MRDRTYREIANALTDRGIKASRRGDAATSQDHARDEVLGIAPSERSKRGINGTHRSLPPDIPE